nr:amidohydrolase [Ralstonia pickettii]
MLTDLVALRRDLHANPELAYEEHRTAGIVAQSLRMLGLEVEEGIGGTGVVGTLRGAQDTRSVALRADMDALPMVELGRSAHASRMQGKDHGCGHDGHTSMLIGAARQLVRTGVDGTVHFIFQPAEEGQAGARRMIEDGLFERFPCDSVYALHNWPDLPLGHAQTRPGPIMAAADRFDITVRGRGGHAAQPHHTPDAILAASQLVAQLHTIVSRRIDPNESAVLSVTRIGGGHSHNVLPAEVRITGTVRSFDAVSQDRIEAALRDTANGIALGSGTQVEVDYRRYYPATINTRAEALLALDAAQAIGLEAAEAPRAAFTSEDFAFMLQRKPGAYLWLGQGRADAGPDGEYPLHHPCYDFNDDALPLGVRWFCEVARRALAAVPSVS